MYKKTIHHIFILIMALAMILGNIIPTQAATPAATSTGPSVYWGALIEGKVPSTTNMQGVFNTFETRSGKKMSIIHWGQPWVMPDGSWGEFQTGYFDNVRNHGSIPMINWASQKLGDGINQPNFQLRNIYNGTYDAYIQRWATAAKNWGHPFFLYFDHEMNGWWLPWAEGKTSNGTIINGNSPGDFVKAWRHVHDIFTAVGATNVSWVWGPNHMSTSSQYPPLSTLYPGDAYVDWTALSVYNKYNTWAGLNPLLTGSEGMTWFRNSYNDVLSLAPNKPMMLAQWASIEAGDGGAKKAAWITDALTTQIPVNFPRIKAIVWLNWMETPDETYPIESSSAVTAAWAAGIASPVYAANQYANLNKSPIPPADAGVVISGSAGVEGVTLSYTDSTAKTTTSGPNGIYSITVTNGWSGTVTPSHTCYTFNPASLSYSNVTADQSNKSYTATLNPAAGCAQLNISIGGTPKGNYGIARSSSLALNYQSLMGGPVKVSGTTGGSIIASQRSVTSGGINEVMGYPASQLTKEYWFTWYDWKSAGVATWILVGNPSTNQDAHVNIYIGGVLTDKNLTIKPGQNITPNHPGLMGGPVHVVSDIDVYASERTAVYNSFHEVTGYPATQFDTEYWFPWYDWLSAGVATWVMMANPSDTDTATVDVYIGGDYKQTFTILPGQTDVYSKQGMIGGPVKVVSKSVNGNPAVPIFASERTVIGNTFNEVMGYPASQFATTYYYPWYENDNTNMVTWILVGNPSENIADTVEVDVYIAGQFQKHFSIPAKQSISPTFDKSSGPLEVRSTNGKVFFTSERILYQPNVLNAFNETFGIPSNRLDTSYYFTWYDSMSMSTSIVVAKP